MFFLLFPFFLSTFRSSFPPPSFFSSFLAARLIPRLDAVFIYIQLLSTRWLGHGNHCCLSRRFLEPPRYRSQTCISPSRIRQDEQVTPTFHIGTIKQGVGAEHPSNRKTKNNSGSPLFHVSFCPYHCVARISSSSVSTHEITTRTSHARSRA
ncbi:hypothetical protein B0T19DRAFT_410766 [Cercophora scortea]|uniref:Secreted protein n=1 Tax=Cercophora scortea TaxID=314031 RepID=A0AAE0J5C6_9PEZI|nr:hypothetical protein B0T19DRAFT_410766 [Cercophora scortea]